MPKVSDIKKGAAVDLDGKKLIVKDISVNSPSARGAATLYKFRFSQVGSGAKVEQTFKGDDQLDELDLERRAVHFSYVDGESYIFMDDEDYSQYPFDTEVIKDELLFVTESTEGLLVLIANGAHLTIELPQSVVLEISDTAPSIKGASASARTKPAEFATGLIIQVPEYIAAGESVKIHTAEKRFMGRANDS